MSFPHTTNTSPEIEPGLDRVGYHDTKNGHRLGMSLGIGAGVVMLAVGLMPTEAASAAKANTDKKVVTTKKPKSKTVPATTTIPPFNGYKADVVNVTKDCSFKERDLDAYFEKKLSGTELKFTCTVPTYLVPYAIDTKVVPGLNNPQPVFTDAKAVTHFGKIVAVTQKETLSEMFDTLPSRSNSLGGVSWVNQKLSCTTISPSGSFSYSVGFPETTRDTKDSAVKLQDPASWSSFDTTKAAQYFQTACGSPNAARLYSLRINGAIPKEDQSPENPDFCMSSDPTGLLPLSESWCVFIDTTKTKFE